jgi:hypothetical protein
MQRSCWKATAAVARIKVQSTAKKTVVVDENTQNISSGTIKVNDSQLFLKCG